jgi:hypothetical protein
MKLLSVLYNCNASEELLKPAGSQSVDFGPLVQRFESKADQGEVHLEYGRRFQNAVDGKVTTVCPRCKALNSVRSDSDERAK